MAELFIGLMSGTSLDGVDAVVADFGTPRPTILGHHSVPFEPNLAGEIRSLGSPGNDELNRLARLDARLGDLYAQCIASLLEKTGLAPEQVLAIGSHGQTIRHCPDAPIPYTLQVGDPNRIAERTGITTVADFRRRDVAAGGQGAPLAPAFHRAICGHPDEHRVVANIGGIANITVLAAATEQPIQGFDTGPGNTLLDAWSRRHLDQPMDEGGQWSSSGNVNHELLEAMADDPYFHRHAPKSTGPEYFNLSWLGRYLEQTGESAPADIQATLCQLTATSLAKAIRYVAPSTQRLLVCGGGARNPDLMQRLADELTETAVESTETCGIDPQWVEALAFAWLAKQTLEGDNGNVPAVTGARRGVILGGIYRGRYKIQDTRYK